MIMEKLFFDYFRSPIGMLKITAGSESLVAIDFIDDAESVTKPNKITRQTNRELEAYFNGSLKEFSVPLKLEGSEFFNSVWNALLKIPYGETRSYSEIAEIIGNPKAARAVGMANNKNKIPIIIPCHRVIGKSGKLVGYASGTWRKKWLIEFERKNLADKFLKMKKAQS